MKAFCDRTVGFWIGLVASVLMLVGDVAFLITDGADRTFSFLTFGLILAGVVCQALVVLLDWKVMPLLCAVCFGSALSYHLFLGLPTLSDVVNGVNYIGGNPTAVVVFGGVFAVGTLLALCASFMNQRKPAISVEG